MIFNVNANRLAIMQVNRKTKLKKLNDEKTIIETEILHNWDNAVQSQSTRVRVPCNPFSDVTLTSAVRIRRKPPSCKILRSAVGDCIAVCHNKCEFIDSILATIKSTQQEIRGRYVKITKQHKPRVYNQVVVKTTQ